MLTRFELITRYPELCAYLMGIGSVELMGTMDIDDLDDLAGFSGESDFETPEELTSEPVEYLLLTADSLDQKQLERIQTFGLRLRRINGMMGGVVASFTLPQQQPTPLMDLTDQEPGLFSAVLISDTQRHAPDRD